MKKLTLLSLIAVFAGAFAFTACNSPEKKVDNAREKVEQEKQDVRDAQNDYAKEIDQYKRDQAQKLADNEKNIAEYRVKIKNDNITVRERREKKVAELEVENKNLRTKLDAYNDNDPNNWQRFKSEFNQSMDHLGNSFKELFHDDDKPRN